SHLPAGDGLIAYALDQEYWDLATSVENPLPAYAAGYVRLHLLPRNLSAAVARTPAELPEKHEASGSNRLPAYPPPGDYPDPHACSDVELIRPHSERVPLAACANVPPRLVGFATLVEPQASLRWLSASRFPAAGPQQPRPQPCPKSIGTSVVDR